jgi:hypothetical protein
MQDLYTNRRGEGPPLLKSVLGSWTAVYPVWLISRLFGAVLPTDAQVLNYAMQIESFHYKDTLFSVCPITAFGLFYY